MELKDCKHDEVYYWESGYSDPGTNGYINKFQKVLNKSNIKYYISAKNNSNQWFYKDKNQPNPVNVRLATLEEIHWLEECANADKYISYDEAMKSFSEPITYNTSKDPKLEIIYKRLLNIK